MMNKFINDPDNLTAELLEGYVMAYSNQVAIGGENIIVRAHAKAEDKVAVITLGGSGHEPALSGFVGDGMLDCSVVGDILLLRVHNVCSRLCRCLNVRPVSCLWY